MNSQLKDRINHKGGINIYPYACDAPVETSAAKSDNSFQTCNIINALPNSIPLIPFPLLAPMRISP